MNSISELWIKWKIIDVLFSILLLELSFNCTGLLFIWDETLPYIDAVVSIILIDKSVWSLFRNSLFRWIVIDDVDWDENNDSISDCGAVIWISEPSFL